MNFQKKIEKYNLKKKMTSDPYKIKLYNKKLNYYNIMIGGEELILNQSQYRNLSQEEKNKYDWKSIPETCYKYIGTLKPPDITEELVKKFSADENLDKITLTIEEYNFILGEKPIVTADGKLKDNILKRNYNKYIWVENYEGRPYDRELENYIGFSRKKPELYGIYQLREKMKTYPKKIDLSKQEYELINTQNELNYLKEMYNFTERKKGFFSNEIIGYTATKK